MIRDLNSKTPYRLKGVNIYQAKNDGWQNIMAGVGKIGTDKTTASVFGNIPYLVDEELGNIYMGDGLAKRIIDLKPQDATREWITIPGDKDEKILKELKRIGAKAAFKKAMSWARLYRGAIIVILEKGVVDLAKPLSSTPKEIQSLRVYSAARINITMTDINNDPTSPYFDEIEVFPITRRNGAPLRVHASRCLIFKGEEAPDEGTIDFKYKYWGIPSILPIYDRLKNLSTAESAIANLILEFNIGKYTLSNLAQILASNSEDQIQKIYNRLEIINASKSMINAVLLGADEGYERDNANVSGLPDLLDRMMIFLSAVSGYPVTKLFGRSPAGQNATGESDLINYYDTVASDQETIMEGPLQKLVNRIGAFYKISDTDLVFNPLWQPTEKEQADVNKINAEIDNIYLMQQVVTSDEVREMRFPELEGSEPIDMPEEEEEEDLQ